MKKTKQILLYCKVVFWQRSCQCLSDFLKSRNWAFPYSVSGQSFWSIWDCIRLKVCTTIISIGNSMICSDILLYVKLFHKLSGKWNLRQFWNITSGIYAKYHIQIMLLFVYTTTRKGFVIFTCRYFKLSWKPLL